MSNAIQIPPSGVCATVDELLEKYRCQQKDTTDATRSRRLVDVGARMVLALRDVTRQYGKTLESDQVAGINDLLRDWDEAIANARAVPTWRARIGRGSNFPLHVPNDVERAMEAQIAELLAQLVPAKAAGQDSEAGDAIRKAAVQPPIFDKDPTNVQY